MKWVKCILYLMLIFGCTTISFAKEWINEEKMIKVNIAVFNDFRKD